MNSKYWAIYFSAACALCLFGWWLIPLTANITLFKAINSALPLQFLWLSLTEFGDALIVGCLTYLVFRNNTRFIFMAIWAGLFTHLGSNKLKHLFHTLRPEHLLIHQDIHLLGPVLSSKNYAFPSGHSMTIVMLLSLVLLLKKPTSLITKFFCCIFGLCVCISRVAVGAHWPSDIIAGAGLGLITAAMGYWAGNQLLNAFYFSAYLNWLGKGICFIFMMSALVRGVQLITVYPSSAAIYLVCATLSLRVLMIDSYRLWKGENS